MSFRAESHSVEVQLQQLRRIFENWPTKPATGADVAFAYITLCTALEFTVGFHVRLEFGKLRLFVEVLSQGKHLVVLHRTGEDGWSHPYACDEPIGRETLVRLIQEEQARCDRLTFGDLSRAVQVLRGTTMPEVCSAVDQYLWGDLQGLNSLRNVYSHGRPVRVDEDEESRHNLEAPGFSLREALKSLRRMKIIRGDGDFFDRAGELFDVLRSSMAITFYWRRAGEFIRSYTTNVPYDKAFHPFVSGIVDATKPLQIQGVDCL